MLSSIRQYIAASCKIINHRFHVDKDKGESGIGYDMIMGRDLMLHLGLTADFKRPFLQWDGATVHMKKPSILLRRSVLTKHKMGEAVMQNSEPDSTREATEPMVKILDSNCEKADLKQVVDNAVQNNYEDRAQLLSLLEEFEDLFDGTLGYWATEPVNLELKPYPKPFNSRYYLVPRINKEIFLKYLKYLVEIGVLTLVDQSQYGTPVFIIPKKVGTVRFITEYCRINQK